MKKIILGLIVVLTIMVLTGCNGKDSSNEIAKVGVLQVAEHPSLDGAREGFIAALKEGGYVEGENLQIDYQNAQGDAANLKSMSTRLVKDSDLILAIATPSAQALANETKDIPILFTAITDPIDAGLVESLDNVGGNLSGTSDLSPIKEQIELLLDTKDGIKTVGLMYNASEPNSVVLIDLAKKELEAKNIKVIEKTVTTTNDILQATQSIVKQVDAIYIPTDNTMSSGMATVGQVVKEAKIPVVTGSKDMTELGGLATYGIDYFKLGEQTGKMALRILKDGVKIGDLKVEYLEEKELVINEEMANALGIDVERLKINK